MSVLEHRDRGVRGAGTVYEHAGVWYLRRSWSENGKRHRKRHGPYKTEAEAKAAQARFAPLTESEVLTVKMWVDRWVESEAADLCRTGSETYAGIIRGIARRYLIPRLGSIKLADLEPTHCDAVWLAMASGEGFTKPLSPKTIREAKHLLKRILKSAMRDKKITMNAADLSVTPRTKRGTKTAAQKIAKLVLTESESVRLVTHMGSLDGPRALAALLTYDTGMRRGEVLGLNWPDVDFKNATLKIDRQWVHIKETKTSELRETKSVASKRTIGLPPETIAYLRAWRRAHPSLNEAMFCDAAGNRPDPDAFTKWFKKQVRLMKLNDGFHFHSLRHNHASWLKKMGRDDEEIAARLGHSTSAVTRQSYLHVPVNSDGDLVERWSKFRAGGGAGAV